MRAIYKRLKPQVGIRADRANPADFDPDRDRPFPYFASTPVRLTHIAFNPQPMENSAFNPFWCV